MQRLSRPLAFLILACLGGCGLQVNTFAGSWIDLSMTWPLQQPVPMRPDLQPQPVLPMAGQHLELWAVLGGGRKVRLSTDNRDTDFPGFAVRPVLAPNDPCMIRALDGDDPCAQPDHGGLDDSVCGAHLLSADAQQGDTADQRALAQMAVVEHARQVLGPLDAITVAGGVTGAAPVPLLVLVQNDPQSGDEPQPTLTPDNAGNGDAARQRAQQCRNFVAAAEHAAFYIGNPRQLTKPVHGVLYGFFNFNTNVPSLDLPPQTFGSITLTTLTSLVGLQGMFLTIESQQNPSPPQMGDPRVLVQGVVLPPDQSGRGAIRLALEAIGPSGMVTVGTASVLTDLTEGVP